MRSITEFLTARYDEEEAVAREALSEGGAYDWDEIPWQGQPGNDNGWGRGEMEFGRSWVEVRVARVLADIAAKRAIVADRVWPIGRFWDGQRAQHDHTLWLLAQPYADHPDFDPSWCVTP